MLADKHSTHGGGNALNTMSRQWDVFKSKMVRLAEPIPLPLDERDHVRWTKIFREPDQLFRPLHGCAATGPPSCSDCLRAQSCRFCAETGIDCSCECQLTAARFEQRVQARSRAVPAGANYAAAQYILNPCDLLSEGAGSSCSIFLPCTVVNSRGGRSNHQPSMPCTIRRLEGWGWNPAAVRLPRWLRVSAIAAGFRNAAYLGTARLALDGRQPISCHNPVIRSGLSTSLLLLDRELRVLASTTVDVPECLRAPVNRSNMFDARLIVGMWEGTADSVLLSYWTSSRLLDRNRLESHWIVRIAITIAPGQLRAAALPFRHSCPGVRLAAARNAALIVHPISGALTHDHD